MTRLESMKTHEMVRFTLAGLTLLLIAGLCQVQGGCSRFGHSCFGAHGKRTDPSNVDYNNVVPLGDMGYMGQQGGAGAQFKSDSWQQPSRYYGANRLPPYLFEWALAAQRAAESRQHEPSKEDNVMDSTSK